MIASNARVVLLAGPSGSGKSYIAGRTGLPVLCLDDFYRDGDDPVLTADSAGKSASSGARPDGTGTVDWESPRSWDGEAAVAAIETLCRYGRAETPVYAFGADRRVGQRTVDLSGAELFVAEGIFAAEIVADCRSRDLLAEAYALRRPRLVTFVRRLARDLAQRRKPPMVLFRRGLMLLRTEPAVLARAESQGARPASARTVLTELATATESVSRR